MATVVLKTLSILLGLFFLLVGAMKLTPHISRDMHRDIRKAFIQYAKVFPLSQTLGFKVSSKSYRKCVGWAEVFCGLTLIFIPGFLKQVANLILLIMMLGAVYTHYAIGEKFERTAPLIVFSFMLTCRFIIYLQDWQKRKQGSQITVATKEEKID